MIFLKKNIFLLFFGVFIFVFFIKLFYSEDKVIHEIIVPIHLEGIKQKNNHVIHQLKYIKKIKKPNFSKIKDLNEKKTAFFDYLYPIIVNKNIEILNIRNKIKNSKKYSNEMINLCKKYNQICDKNTYKEKLFYSVNIIPASLAMAQAANESAWGTSNFAINGNNFFGIWCFKKGCGIVPSKRENDLIHEVKSFNSPEESVSYYIDNLNKNSKYELLRDIRLKSNNSKNIAKGLISYSEKGFVYINEIISIINFNNLENYDVKMLDHLSKWYNI